MRRRIKLVAGLAALAVAGGGAVEQAHAYTPPNFDPVVTDALEDTAGISGLVNNVLADLPSDTVPTSTGLTGAIPGGSGTEELVGWLNGGMSRITGPTNDVLAGRDLSPEQVEALEFLIRKGPSIEAWRDIMAVSEQIDIDLANAHLRELYPFGFTDSTGTHWVPDHETGRWHKVTTDRVDGTPIYRPAPLAPPPVDYPDRPSSSPGDNSGSIDNDEPKPSLLDDPPLSLFG